MKNMSKKVLNMKLIAKGNTAEVYEYGDNLICKLFCPQYPAETIEHEFYNATMAWKLGIRTPKAHRIIMEDNRQGIIYDQIVGEVLSEKISESSELVYDEWMDRFVNFHKQLMQHNIDDAMSYKDFLKMFATDDKAITKINALDDGNCFLHGDFHLKNVMLDENNQLVVIDMMNVCKGPELYDVARTYFLLNYDSNIQRKYIEKMGYSVEDIRPYLDVILMVRENEMRGTNI